MPGMSYEINEIKTYSSNVDLSDVMSRLETHSTATTNDLSTEYVKLQLHYSDNFCVKELHKICEYYNIDKRKKRKDELINDIIIFEIAEENTNLVENRKKMWSYMQELKNDTYLKKYIVWD